MNQPELPKRKINIQKVLFFALLFIGIHSLILGIFIYFFTDFYYEVFFKSEVVNPFFVRQSGIFLICNAVFYLMPLFDLKRFYPVVFSLVVTKIIAVLFLLINAGITLNPTVIRLAAAGDGSMAVFLLILLIYQNSQAKSCESD
jgi:hypothetical protein